MYFVDVPAPITRVEQGVQIPLEASITNHNLQGAIHGLIKAMLF
jgi:hypothetical protein